MSKSKDDMNFERALFTKLLECGMLLPTTDEDVKTFEGTMGQTENAPADLSELDLIHFEKKDNGRLLNPSASDDLDNYMLRVAAKTPRKDPDNDRQGS